MQNILSDIQARNSKRVLQTKTAPVFDQAEVDEYLRKADASSNPVDKENAKELRKYLDELNNNKTDIATLVREGKISSRLANALNHSDVVEVPSSEIVDVDLFETMSDDGK